MFKIVKILNSAAGVPEPVRLKANSSLAYKAGSALILSSGKAANATATSKPTFIAAQDLKAGEAATLRAYPVTPDLILETTFSATPSGIAQGSAVTLNVSSSVAVGVTATTTDGVATVFDMLGAAASGDRVLVRFL